MDIAKKFGKASIQEIEAHIGRLVNERDSLNGELLELNALRDQKVREKRRAEAAAAFEAEHGVPPEQVIRPGSAVAGTRVEGGGFLGGLGKLFGRA
jgi:hypothetical protein